MDAQPHTNNEDLLSFFRALAGPERLMLAGRLAERPHTLDELAALPIKRPDLPRLLDSLVRSGLATTQDSPRGPLFTIDRKSIAALARRLFAAPPSASSSAADALPQDVRKLLAGFLTREGRLSHLPAQGQKLQAALRYAAALFAPERRYTEKEVKETLSRLNEDTASLRRSLVDFGYLGREKDGSSYWLLSREPAHV